MRFNTRSLAISALAALPKLVSSALIPNADTPVFFLVGLDSFGDSLKVSTHPSIFLSSTTPAHPSHPCTS
jgi:hypothetical protein